MLLATSDSVRFRFKTFIGTNLSSVMKCTVHPHTLESSVVIISMAELCMKGQSHQLRVLCKGMEYHGAILAHQPAKATSSAIEKVWQFTTRI